VVLIEKPLLELVADVVAAFSIIASGDTNSPGGAGSVAFIVISRRFEEKS
jgi:hypothetical protein